jgi:hypothetical protein
MSALPVQHKSAGEAAETVEQRFRRLEAIWKSETWFSSNPTEIIANPAFQEIIGMGEAVIPLMLRDLDKEPRLWVWALPRITGRNPVPAGSPGNISKMSEAWLRRGRENGYRW